MLFKSDLVMFWRILDILKKNFRAFLGEVPEIIFGLVLGIM